MSNTSKLVKQIRRERGCGLYSKPIVIVITGSVIEETFADRGYRRHDETGLSRIN